MRAMNNGALSRFNPAQPGAQGMKVVATGLLLVMAAVFFASRALEPQYPWLGYVKSFAEAAMVGGLADWFAVTALFRHPLGLPIPHTAIIPRNKDRIGEALATFLKENFLIPSVVARRMRNIDVAGAVGQFLQSPSQEEQSRIRAGASRLIADVFESLDDERLGGIVKGAISSRLRAMEVSPLLGHALASAINEDRHVPMLEAAIRWTARALDANEPLIREMVHKKANWVLKLAGLDAKLADAIIDGLRKLTVEMSTDPAHPVRQKIEEALAQLANDLQTKPETRERVEIDQGAVAGQQVRRPLAGHAVAEGPRGDHQGGAQPGRGARRKARRGAEIDGRHARERSANPEGHQPVCPPRRRRHGLRLRELDRQAGIGNGAELGRADGHQPPRIGRRA